MKKVKLLLSLGAMLSLVFALATGAAAGVSDSIYNSCTMYSQPGGGYAVRSLYAGMPITVDEQRGNWTAIITLDAAGNHVDGWVSTSNLTNTGHNYRSYTPTYNTYYAPQSVPSGNGHTVLTATMHTGADENTPTTCTVPINVPITVTQDLGNGWVQICYNGTYGYVSRTAVSYYATNSAPAYNTYTPTYVVPSTPAYTAPSTPTYTPNTPSSGGSSGGDSNVFYT